MTKEVSQDFQNELLHLFKLCLDNHTNGLTLTLVYPHAKLCVEMTFTGEKVNDDCRS